MYGMKPGGNRPMAADRYDTEGRGEKGMRYGAESARRQKAGKLRPSQKDALSRLRLFRCLQVPVLSRVGKR